MLELRRLRAVLLLSLVSALAWGGLATLWILGGRLVSGAPLLAEPILIPFLIFGFFGLIAGGLFAVGLGLASSRGRHRVSRGWGSLFGALGGALVWLGMRLAVIEPSPTMPFLETLIPGAMCAGLGAAVGLTICHLAAREALPSASQNAIRAG